MKHRTYEDSWQDALQGPEFCTISETNTAKRAISGAVMGERIKPKLTQREVAMRAEIHEGHVADTEYGVLPVIITLT